MTREGYDAWGTNALTIPANAQVVFPYNDDEGGTWTLVERARFKGQQFTITRRPDKRANILDVESGAAKPQDVPGWLADFALLDPVVYSSLSTLPALIRYAGMPGFEPGADWYWFAADPTQHSHEVPDAIMVQWGWFATFDQSTIYADWWNPALPEELTMAKNFDVIQDGSGRIIAVFAEDENRHLLQYTPPATIGAHWTYTDLSNDAHTVPLAP